MPNGHPVARAAAGREVLALLGACHPEPAALVTILTCLLALAAGRGWGTLLLGAAAGSGQLAVGWANDYLDRDLDRRAGRADKPLAAGAGRRRLEPALVRSASLAALAVCLPLSLAVSAGFALAHFAAIGSAMAYNAWLKFRPLSVLPYAVSFGLLPVAVALGLPDPHWPHAWAVAAGALIGAGGHFTQALPDIPEDRRLGIRGLPQVIGQRASGAAAAGLLLAGNLTVTLAAAQPGPIQAAVAALAVALTAGIVVAAFANRPRLAFRLTLAAAGIAVLAFLAGGRQL